MQTIIHWIIYSLAILITAYILPGVSINGLLTALVLAVVLAVINIFLRPVILLLTLPLTIVTLGVSVLVVNTLLIILASYLVPGFNVNNFWWAFLFSVVLTAVNWVLQGSSKRKNIHYN